jgi:UDP-N-acetylmuramoyl-tripeptide--D-alanyl-D-alanine ligase
MWASIISLAAFVIFFCVYFYADGKVALHSPATLTPRFKRLLAILWLVYAIVCYIVITLLNFADSVWGNEIFSFIKYCALAIMPLLINPLICLANLIAKIYEVPHNKKYVKKAKAALKDSKIKVVGITGSYGKTSAKFILSALLSTKYKVLATPRSYNTPMGIATTINGNKLDDYDIFIAEMGARNVGDIKQLCNICTPDYALITGICPQHLESFLSVENIIKEKGQIISAATGKTFISADCFDLFKDINGDKVKCDVVSNVVADCNGTAFTLTLGGKKIDVNSKLLGEHSAYNIGLCALIAFELGVTPEEIKKAIGDLDYVEHRLQLIKNNGVNIIDDGYNSNPSGAVAALKVLRSFEGTKIVVTPGLVELGILEKQENTELGKNLVGLDCVILVGDTLVSIVKEGYLSAGGDKEKLFVVPNLIAAQDKLKGIIKSGDTVLFLNDLPDKY